MQAESKSSQNMHVLPSGVDRARLLAVIEPIAHARGAEIFDVELKNEAGEWVLRVFVEKLGSSDLSASSIKEEGAKDTAIDLGLCANVARDLSPALDVPDVENLIPHRYTLEVSSPGVERPLKTARDFARFSGQKAKLKLVSPVNGQKVLRGLVQFDASQLSADDPKFIVVQDSHEYEVVLSNVRDAHLVFEFGPARSPSAKKKHPKQTSAAHESRRK